MLQGKTDRQKDKVVIQPGWVRAAHWLNAAAVVIMVLSGWRIYDASPFYPFRFPEGITLGGWLAGALLYHFAAMWLLVVNGLIYLALNLASGRARRRFWPLSLVQMGRDLRSALLLRLAHDELGMYNAVQKFAYLFVWVDLVLLVLSGLVLWKSVQFPLLRELLGGYDVARRVHFWAMALLVGFTLIHLVMVLLVPRSLITMLRGR